MTDDKKMLLVTGVEAVGTDLNAISTELTDICQDLYTKIIYLNNNEAFKTKLAAPEYFAKLDQLNTNVPKYAEAILKFSQFLSKSVLEDYAQVDKQISDRIGQNLAASIEKLGTVGVISGASVDYSKISSSAQGALNRSFIDESKIGKQHFENGELQFITRDDGSVQIVKDGTVMGYTTQEAIIPDGQEQSASTGGSPTPEDYKAAGTSKEMQDLYNGLMNPSPNNIEQTSTIGQGVVPENTVPNKDIYSDTGTTKEQQDMYNSMTNAPNTPEYKQNQYYESLINPIDDVNAVLYRHKMEDLISVTKTEQSPIVPDPTDYIFAENSGSSSPEGPVIPSFNDYNKQ